MNPRTIAIGDIHGCSAALDALLEAIRPRPEDCIVTLGDYINRGPDSRGVIERLIELKDRCRLVPLLGNHDQMLLDVQSRKLPARLACSAWGVRHPRLLRPRTVTSDSSRTTHFEFLEGCLDYFETDTHIFVHANYFPDIPMGEQHVGMLRWESLRD